MKKTPSNQQDLFAAPAQPAERVEPLRAEMPKEVSLPVPAWRQSAPEPTVLTVGELTRQIKYSLEKGFSRVILRGEVSGYRGPNPRGHLYFSLKDAEATIEARIWASLASRLKFKLAEGMSVIAEGNVDVYPPSGRYSLIVQRLEPEGVGALAMAFAQLKERLTKEGLMGERRVRPPRPLPFLPQRIGVVTSLTGAALKDFLRVLHNRHPYLSVLICDARVQGDGASREVVRALDWLGRTDVDVIVVTRGGGSIEDLWTFNEEAVARAIHACPVPVVSAIGHEVDFTIADFVADFRAPTPSAAAEKLAPELSELKLKLSTSARRLQKAVERGLVDRHRALALWQSRLPDPRRLLSEQKLFLSDASEQLALYVRRRLRIEKQNWQNLSERHARQSPRAQLVRSVEQIQSHKAKMLELIRATLVQARQRLHDAKIRWADHSPRHRLSQEKLRVDSLKNRLIQAMRARLEFHRSNFMNKLVALNALSPLGVMSRGYALAYTSTGRVVRQSSDVSIGDTLRIRVTPRSIQALEQADVIEATVVATESKA